MTVEQPFVSFKGNAPPPPSRRRSSLRRRLLLWFLCVALVPLTLVSIISYHTATESLRTSAQNTLAHSTVEQARFIKSWFNSRFVDLESQATSSSNARFLSQLREAADTDTRTLTRFVKSSQWHDIVEERAADLRTFHRLYEYYDVFLIDANGDILFTVAEESDLGTNLFTGPYAETRFADACRTALETGRPVFSDLESYAPSENANAGFLADVIVDDQGNKVGLFAIQITPHQITNLLRHSEELHPGMQMYVVGASPDQHVATLRTALEPIAPQQSNIDAPHAFEPANYLNLPIDNAQTRMWVNEYATAVESDDHDTHQDPVLSYVGPNGQLVLGVHENAEIANINWGIIAEIPESIAFASARNLNKLVIGLVIVTCLVVVVVALYTTTRIIRPITELSRAAYRIAQGDLTQELISPTNDEIGDLAQYFNWMLTNLSSVFGELTNQKNALDEHAIVSITDIKGNIVHANDQFCELSGYTRAELIGQNHRLVKSTEHSPEFYRHLWTTVSSGNVWTGELKNRTKDGGYYWVDATIVPFKDEAGKPTQYVAIRTDITQRKEAEKLLEEKVSESTAIAVAAGEARQELQSKNTELTDALEEIEAARSMLIKSESHTRAILESAADAIISIDATGTITHFNPGAERTFGYQAREIIGDQVLTLIPPEYREAHLEGMSRYFHHGESNILNRTVQVDGLRNDGIIFPLELTISADRNGAETMFTAIGRDITERKEHDDQLRQTNEMLSKSLEREKETTDELEEAMLKLEEIAATDKLTGLPNRKTYLDRLELVMNQSKRDGGLFAVLFFDFDRFKIVNDSLGHKFGDALLCDIADIFRRELRETDLAARFGGDEFVVLLSNLTDPTDAHLKANRLLQVFAEPHHLDGHVVVSTASIGLVTNERTYESAADMIRDADVAMYQAKDAGKCQVQTFGQAMHEKAMERLVLEGDLRSALERNQLRLLYQPIIELSTGELSGFEALVRWEHPERGCVSPLDFITIAEDTGLIVEIGKWFLHTAAQQIADWNIRVSPHRKLSMNVNVSKRQLLGTHFLEDALECQRLHELHSKELKLEITESVIVDDRADIVPLLHRLRAEGFPIVMDDFGTGVSSLGTLNDYPIDVLKIDQSFIRPLDQDRSLLAIVAAIANLAQNLGIATVVEGIESESIVGAMQSIDCVWGQGYHFARPLDTAHAESFIIERQQRAHAA